MSVKRPGPAPSSAGLRRRWHRLLLALFLVVVAGSSITAVSMHKLVDSYRLTAEELRAQADVTAALRERIVEDAVSSAQKGGADREVTHAQIRELFDRRASLSEAVQGRAQISLARGQWEAVNRKIDALDPASPLPVRAAAIGELIGTETPKILTTIDLSAQADRAKKSADLAKGARAERATYVGLLLLALLCLAGLLLLARRLVTEVIRPVIALQMTANQLAAGDLSHRADIDRPDEIGDLARSLNCMADAISGSHRSLSHQALHDSLTGLANRAGFRAAVEQAFAHPDRRSGRQAVLCIDLDDFKNVNDSLGHAAGDEVLRVVAERLRGVVRAADVVARLGGDEFAILLDGVPDEAVAVELANRVVAALAEPVELQGQEHAVGASVGVCVRADGVDLDALMRQADVAMYAAKGKGKNRVECYDVALDDALQQHQTLRRELAGVVERNELVLNYQPLLDLQSGELIGVEALVRWMHPTRGMLPPSAFIGLAEETGAIIPIGDWVLRTATTQAVQWQRRYGRPDLIVSVNASVCQLERAGYAQVVEQALRDSGLAGANLIIEVTETVVADPAGNAANELRALQRAAVRVALDDFGSGFCSIPYLQQLPIDILKIDRAFVTGATGDAARQELLGGLVSLGQRLGHHVIPEGIEATDDLLLVQQLGCLTGQGFLLAKPLAAEDLDRWLGTGRTADAVHLSALAVPAVPRPRESRPSSALISERGSAGTSDG